MKIAFSGLMALAFFMPVTALAGAAPRELVRPAQYGTVREVVGNDLPIVIVRDACATAMRPIVGGPCFDTVKATGAPQRVVALGGSFRNGTRVNGDYGRDFTLYDVRQGEHGLEVRAVPYATSDVHVPRDCFALNGEGVGYVVDTVNGTVMAQESQYVVCGGGPDRPNGPYRPGGPVISSDSRGWGRTETALAEGQHRYLGIPNTPCDSAYIVRSTCAKPAVLFMNANPDTNELDLIAPKATVRSGDIVDGKDIQQWVMKRKSDGSYKADSRWFAKSMFTDGNGCWASEAVRWYVGEVPDGLDITEKAMSRCGAAAAPIPAATYAVYGEDYYILNCAWNRRGDNSGNACADQAKDYLKRQRQESATMVVLNQPARVGDHLYDGGYVSYDLVVAELKGDAFRFRSDGGSVFSGIYDGGCQETDTGNPESKGFVIVRSLGISWARAYRWMACNVY
jgi:hypothetical protein